MSTTITTSVFETLGYQVMSRELGVYVLRNLRTPSLPPAVALLLTPYPVQFPVVPVQLFLQQVPDGVTADAVAAHWNGLDARRFEESGFDPVALELGPIPHPEVAELTFERPEGGRRFALKLPSDDIVCFN